MSETIVVGYDDKEPAKRALERALEETRSRHGRLVVVTVAEMPLDPEGPTNFGTLDDSPARMIPLVLPPDLEQAVAHARERTEAEGVEAEFVWAAGEPSNTILDVARDRGASLIVVGVHHGGFFSKVFGEDVAAEVRRQAGCDVVVAD